MKRRRNGKYSFALGASLAFLICSFASAGYGQIPAAQKRESASKPETALSPELEDQLVALRDGALADDYAYKQVAFLTENDRQQHTRIPPT